ncbi:transglycosylase SLT domain-containing protein [Bdellovibrio sp.]|uniref:transglycosylase SLT domain-containing protein n=1 Tax=Bdellovibrio sp. TaxID=28201 RepID=UPI0039E2267E
MPKASTRKVTTVHEHKRRVKPSLKNPKGITLVDQHLRRIPGTYLDPFEIQRVFSEYDRKNIVYPAVGKLPEYKEKSDKFDNQIAVWTDYFNKKFKIDPPLEPNVVKALIASESSFNSSARTRVAIGIAQITKSTLKILQDPNGEVKEFIFGKIRQKDLENPDIAIPMGIRWLAWKRERAMNKLGRAPTNEEIILEYKGLLKSKSAYKNSALEKYRTSYASLTKK